VIFNSFEFLFFFLTLVLVRSCLRNFGVEKWFLLVASYGFYMGWSIPCVLLILCTSGVDSLIGWKLGRMENPAQRKGLLAISLAVNLGVLAFFKYTNFLLENVWFGMNALGFQVNRLHYDIILPIGVSYFTFASMSYTLDVYYERLSPGRSVRDYLLFVAFFPKLLAGPIQRAANFLPQLQQRVRANVADIEVGLAYFLLGAVKKAVISDQIAGHIDLIFTAPDRYDGFTLLQGVLGYAVQIYCDFSGYSDMAVGCARIMGFHFLDNFQMPYSSVSITEFWRRWHITLSSWFRDYVFLPLEVATRDHPNATRRASFNLTLTMLLVGLWHGASWNFVFWGGLHGVSLAGHKAWTAWHPLASLKSRPAFQIVWTLFSRLLTLGVVLLGWIFFRAQSWTTACQYVSRLLTWSNDGTRLVSPYILPALAAVFLTHLLVNKDRNWAQTIVQRSIPVRILAYAALLIVLVCLGATDAAPFIYFQF